jgi:hypothetical protein
VFDAMTGQLVNPGSPAGFLVFLVIVVVALVLWKKLNPDSFKSAVAKAKAEVDDIQARMEASGPAFAAKLEADLKAAKARLEALLK